MKKKLSFLSVTLLTVLSFSIFIYIVLQEENKQEQTMFISYNESTERIISNKTVPKDIIQTKQEVTKENKKKKETEVTLLSSYDNTYEVTSFVDRYVNISSLNMRIGPSTEYAVASVLTQNQKVKAESGDGQEGWVQIKTDNKTGYVNKSYLTNKQISQEPQKKENIEVVSSSKEKKDNSQNKQSEDKSTNTKEPKKEEKPINDAMKLSSVDSNNQLILVTSNGYNSSRANVQTFERDSNGNWKQMIDTNGYIGKNGFSGNKVEGDGKSPTGKYSIGTAFGRSGNPGTNLPFKGISSDDVWVDDPKSSLYNTWQSKKETKDQWNSAEDMDIDLYTYGFVINYNTNRTPGKGSAIFFHIANGHTLGCTGVSQSHMVQILKWLDPNKNPVIIQTPTSELANY